MGKTELLLPLLWTGLSERDKGMCFRAATTLLRWLHQTTSAASPEHRG